eukprot:10540434-Ditylum_brightwellii.AAC.1
MRIPNAQPLLKKYKEVPEKSDEDSSGITSAPSSLTKKSDVQDDMKLIVAVLESNSPNAGIAHWTREKLMVGDGSICTKETMPEEQKAEHLDQPKQGGEDVTWLKVKEYYHGMKLVLNQYEELTE